MSVVPIRQVRAVFDDTTIRVYQAYSNVIADSALAHGTFVEPEFKMTRMTWIKPSFLWMMYRCGWGSKDSGQQRVLAIDITREGFEWALQNSCLSHPENLSVAEARALMNSKPVRVQWDPERDIRHGALAHRSIQVGLGADSVRRYVEDWIVGIEDITEFAGELSALIQSGRDEEVYRRLPVERPYPLPGRTAAVVGADR